MTGIYKIENKHNGKVYIGKSKDIMNRWSTHEKDLTNHTHHSSKMQEDFDKYGGIEAFDFSIVEKCDASELTGKEKFYFEQFDSIASGYNGNDLKEAPEKEEIIITSAEYQTILDTIGTSCLTTYLYFKFHADNENKITINQSALADYFGIKVLTLGNHIRSMLDYGIIAKAGKSGLYNIYKILI